MEELKRVFLEAVDKDPNLLNYKWAELERRFGIPPTDRPGDRARKWFRRHQENAPSVPGIKGQSFKIALTKDSFNVPDKIAPRRLFFDIETSPNIGLFWNAGYKQNISYENIIQERAIICIAYKWEGDKDATCLFWDKEHNDKTMLEKFIKVANTADELVGHNGDKFDLAWIRTRCLLHGIEMFPKYITVDTLKLARSKFRFNSNRLDYIASFLGLGAKIHTSFDLWKKILLDSDKQAKADMMEYCKGDVFLLEKVFNLFRNHIEPKQHYGALLGGNRGSCPECGSLDLIFVKNRTTATGILKKQYQCKDCGKYHTKGASAL